MCVCERARWWLSYSVHKQGVNSQCDWHPCYWVCQQFQEPLEPQMTLARTTQRGEEVTEEEESDHGCLFHYLREERETFLRSCSHSDFAELANILMMSRSTVNVFPLPMHPLEMKVKRSDGKGKRCREWEAKGKRRREEGEEARRGRVGSGEIGVEGRRECLWCAPKHQCTCPTTVVHLLHNLVS